MLVTESFDTTTAAKVHTAVRDGAASLRAANSPLDEIGLRLYEIPAFRKIAEQMGMQIARELALAPTP